MIPNTNGNGHDTARLLRDLNNEHRDTLEALNHAEASIARARKLNDINYHRRRKAILAEARQRSADVPSY
jgi:hypothetical protein